MRPSRSGVWLAGVMVGAGSLLPVPLAALPEAPVENIRAVALPEAGLENIGAEPAADLENIGAEPAGAGEPAGPTVPAELTVPAGPTAGADTPVTLADDAWHYSQWRDGRHDTFYTEWWYFNLHDPRAGIDAIFSYFASNPDDIGGLGMVQMVAVAYTADGTVRAIDRYPVGEFDAGEASADVRIGDNRAWREADGTYRVAGKSLDGRLEWELEYAGDGAPWFAADRMLVGPTGAERKAWEAMSWLVQMPRARVGGTVRVDGREYVVRGSGYHDHNWGEWIPTDATWNWAQFSGPRVAIEVGDFIGKPVGVVALDLDGTRTVFLPDQYSLVHTRWGWDRVNRLFFPTESLLTADNGALRLEVTLRALKTEPLRGDLPAPLRDLIIYEQTARFEGRVWEWVSAEGVGGASADGSEGAGEWRVRSPVRGMGFKEWTGKK